MGLGHCHHRCEILVIERRVLLIVLVSHLGLTIPSPTSSAQHVVKWSHALLYIND